MFVYLSEKDAHRLVEIIKQTDPGRCNPHLTRLRNMLVSRIKRHRHQESNGATLWRGITTYIALAVIAIYGLGTAFLIAFHY